MNNILIFPLEKVRLYKQTKEQNFLNVNIFDCLEYHTKEQIYKNNKIYCKNCKQHIFNFSICDKFGTFPKILTIFLERGNNLFYDVEFQINDTIEDFKKYLINLKNNNLKNGKISYELIGIVAYTMKNKIEDYFLSYCKSYIDKKWHLYNNLEEKYCEDPIESLIGVPYLLFYKRTNF